MQSIFTKEKETEETKVVTVDIEETTVRDIKVAMTQDIEMPLWQLVKELTAIKNIDRRMKITN